MSGRLDGLETLLSSLGERGRYQMSMLILLSCTYILLVFNHVVMAFHGMGVPHSCVPGNLSVTEEVNATFTLTGAQGYSQLLSIESHKCSSVEHFSDGHNLTTFCEAGQFVYHPKNAEKTIVSDFDLVCSNKDLSSLATTIYFAGVMLGGLVFGDLADRLGRLPVLLGTLYMSVVLGVATAFSVNYVMFVVLRFAQGVLMQGMQTSAYTMVMELFVARLRPMAGSVIESFFGVSVMLLAGLAYALQDWRHLQLAVSIPGVLAVFYVCVVPESLRWLLMKGKFEKAEALIRKICQKNQVAFPAAEWQKLKEETSMKLDLGSEQKEHTMIDLVKTSQLRKRSFALLFIWLTISTTYYGLTFKMTVFKWNKYMTFFIGGAVESVCYILSLPVMRYFGRKKPLLVCLLCACVTCLAAGLLNDHSSGLTYLIIALALAGRCATAFLFAIIFVFSSELFPTLIRNIGMGFCCFWARLGGVLAPQVNQWAKTVVGFDAIIIFGVLAGIAAVCVLVLPETHNCLLPDALHDVTEGHVLNKKDKDLMEEDAVALQSMTNHQMS
ncbi:organic cation transporter protein [Aplysia californica]|uniref:Organic cation transporter protein n=1 Tax=Aplysia californica TaxID=6500 RepID=A0ABM0JWU8_APLCA|nr:organic cation transporter protein [Aplysia californica]